MVSQQKEDQSKWNWESILELLETFFNNQTRFVEAIKSKFLKTLLNYYMPSNMNFVYIDWKPENFIQAKVYLQSSSYIVWLFVAKVAHQGPQIEGTHESSR